VYGQDVGGERLVTGMHLGGINMRHLGWVRAHCRAAVCRTVCLSDMLFRVWKDRIREHMRSGTTLAIDAYIPTLVTFITDMFVPLDSSAAEWNAALKEAMCAKFDSALTPDELSRAFTHPVCPSR
jgi:hypothetical protein